MKSIRQTNTQWSVNSTYLLLMIASLSGCGEKGDGQTQDVQQKWLCCLRVTLRDVFSLLSCPASHKWLTSHSKLTRRGKGWEVRLDKRVKKGGRRSHSHIMAVLYPPLFVSLSNLSFVVAATAGDVLWLCLGWVPLQVTFFFIFYSLPLVPLVSLSLIP